MRAAHRDFGCHASVAILCVACSGRRSRLLGENGLAVETRIFGATDSSTPRACTCAGESRHEPARLEKRDVAALHPE